MSEIKFGEWQPMETAPMDGTVVILYRSVYNSVGTGHFIEKHNLWCMESDNPWEVTHMSIYDDNYLKYGARPDLWQPLPQPPA